MKSNKRFFKNILFGTCAAVIAGVSAMPICYAGETPFTSLSPSLSTAADEITPVEFNKLGRDIAEPAFNDVKTKVEQTTADNTANFETRTSLYETYLDQINTWINADGSINDLNSPEDLVGNGTQDSPYIIKTVTGWVWFYCKATYKLVANIQEAPTYLYASLTEEGLDFKDYKYDMPMERKDADGNTVGGFLSFCGVLDGKGAAIKNLALSSSGLFTGIGCFFDGENAVFYDLPESQIKDLTMQGYAASSAIGIGIGVALGVNNCNFENVKFDFGTMTDQMGIFGYVFSGRFKNCEFNLVAAIGAPIMAAVDPSIIGSSAEVGPMEIIDCHSHVDLYGGGAMFIQMGLYLKSLKFENCTADGKIYGSNGGDGSYIGFLGGMGGQDGAQSHLEMTNCVNRTSIAGS